jgi:hypothetical protein
MASWIDAFLDELTVYWKAPAKGVEWTWGPPAQILGRWQYSDGRRGPSVRYGQAETISAKTVVWTSVIMQPQWYLWKGDINDLPGIDPPPPDSAAQVVTTTNVRDLVDSFYLYKAFLDE